MSEAERIEEGGHLGEAVRLTRREKGLTSLRGRKGGSGEWGGGKRRERGT